MISWRTVFYLIVLVIATRGDSYSWYSTVQELRNLLQTEAKIVEDLKIALLLGNTTVNVLLTQIKSIKNLPLESFTAQDDDTDKHTHRAQYNKWFNLQLSHLQRDILPLDDSRIDSIFNQIASFPKDDDLEVVHSVLLDLQKLHNLSAKDISQGYIMGTFAGSSLSTPSCYGLAEIACNKLDNYNHEMCLAWSQEAHSRLNDTAVIYNEDDLLYIKKFREKMSVYSNLCAASINESYIENASSCDLRCFMWDNYHHPWLVVQPIRTELMSVNPTIVLFYNIISDKVIEHLRGEAQTMLGKAMTGSEEKIIQRDGQRVAHNFWLQDPNDEIMRYLDRFTEAVTGLFVQNFSEALQIANYGVGGHYKPHYDSYISLEDTSESVGRRATLMYYLSDVQYGGATAFIHPKIAVRPVKGGAVFWHNLKFDTGLVDGTTMHGSCPVLLGSKWVANKWIWDSGNGMCREHRYD